MTTYIRDFGCHDYRMQTEVDLSTNAKRLIRIGDDGARHPGEWQRLPAGITAAKLERAGFRVV